MAIKKTADQEYEELLADLLQPADPDEMLSVFPFKEIHERYPDVPIEYAVKWDEYDKRLQENEDTVEAIRSVIDALERAKGRCQMLLQKDFPMSPSYRTSTHNILAETTHKTEVLINDLQLFYPCRTNASRYSHNINASSDLSPRLLQNTSDSILIWMPYLPRNTRTYNSLVYAELKELLQSNPLPSIQQWHCDFIHVFNNRTPFLGVMDVDNYPYKPIIDALASALCTTDGHYNFSCGMYNMTSADLIPGCYLHITKREQKVQFFKDFEAFALPLSNAQKA